MYTRKINIKYIRVAKQVLKGYSLIIIIYNGCYNHKSLCIIYVNTNTLTRIITNSTHVIYYGVSSSEKIIEVMLDTPSYVTDAPKVGYVEIRTITSKYLNVNSDTGSKAPICHL